MSDILGPLSDLSLARRAVDRDAVTRERPELFAELAVNPATRYLSLWNGRTLIGDDDRLRSAERIPDGAMLAYLGRRNDDAAKPGSPIMLAVLDDAHASAVEADESRWLGIRELSGRLSPEETGFLTAGLALANWHRLSAFCPRCGAQTCVEKAGWSRRCPSCNDEIFPRTDPAVIVLVLDDDDRLLLGSNVLWQAGLYSLLAGFVEAGESIEQAVTREVLEESGLTVVDPRYLGSQPWPFPRSIMLGFSARLAPGTSPGALQPDGEEIVDLRWLGRDELRAEAATLLLPGTASIAHALIEHWLIADGGPGIRASREAALAAMEVAR